MPGRVLCHQGEKVPSVSVKQSFTNLLNCARSEAVKHAGGRRNTVDDDGVEHREILKEGIEMTVCASVPDTP